MAILRKNGRRFFIGTAEYDLHDPEPCLFLGMATEMNEFQARQQKQKSIINRIARAKRGIPSAGKLPHGRTFDKKTSSWSLDPKKLKNIQWAAEQYLSGKSLVHTAKALGMNVSNLWKILTQLSGDTWAVQFKCADLNIDETVEIKIPRLLPQETIDRILERAKANKTYKHGHIKYKYLLNRMVFCSKCGYAMSGQTNTHGNRPSYYRHARQRIRECNMSFRVPGEKLERAVVANLFSMFGDVSAIEKAIERAFPNVDEIRELEEQLPVLEGNLMTAKKEMKNIISAIGKGIIHEGEAKANMDKLREQESALQKSIDELKQKIESVPTRQRIRREAHSLADRIRKGAITRPFTKREHFNDMSFESKRELVQHVFAGTDQEGKRLGVYVQKNSQGEWTFSVKGILSIGDDYLPLNAAHEELIDDDSFDPARDLLPEDFAESATKFALPLPAGDPLLCHCLSGTPPHPA